MVVVVATIETEAGQRVDVLKQFARIVPLVRQEVGCLAYSPAVDMETNVNTQAEIREDVITVVEQWESIDALEMHLMAPHMLEFRETVKQSVRSVSLRIMEPAE